MAMTRVTAAIQPRFRSSGEQPSVQRQSPGSAASSAAESLVTYIPTEVVTAYVAVLGLLHVPAGGSHARQWLAFWIFLVLAPFGVWAAMAYQEKARRGRIPLRPALWPTHTAFNMTAATLSFALWGFSLPNTPFQDLSWYSSELGTAALIIGTLLIGFVSPLFRADANVRREEREQSGRTA
ncbi:hypothetical protein [Streptomyces sp. NPDC057002]|uniref:hypothetical protein n=1 Tax=Streptomyces sp. NPDC057002 TaxID=3345992 RepID=UPI00362E479C